MVRKCVLESSGKFDLAIGNPPFIRNQDLAKTWTAAARSLILRSLGQDIGRLSNLYLYFLWLAMLRTKSDGVIAMVLPFEWTFRPTSRRLRSYIHQKGWEVTVYRFTQPDRYFPRIAAVPSVTIIDKATTQGGISVFDVGPRLGIFRALPPNSTIEGMFEYERHAGRVFARRGLSPGSQHVFTLTERERSEAGIARSSVHPCVTSLRALPYSVRQLTGDRFRSYYVNAGKKCWLLRTDAMPLPPPVAGWLRSAPGWVKRNSTCRDRYPWYRYKVPTPAAILYSSAFKGTVRPKMMVNAVRAVNLGSVHGVHGLKSAGELPVLYERLRRLNYARGTLPGPGGLRKLEVRQMNGILKRFYMPG